MSEKEEQQPEAKPAYHPPGTWEVRIYPNGPPSANELNQRETDGYEAKFLTVIPPRPASGVVPAQPGGWLVYYRRTRLVIEAPPGAKLRPVN